MKKTCIHVIQEAIRRNHTGKEHLEPVIEVDQGTYKWRANGFDLMYNDTIVASFIYKPDKPLPGGARLWVELPEHTKIKGRM